MNEGAIVGENTTKKSVHHVVSDMVLHENLWVVRK